MKRIFQFLATRQLNFFDIVTISIAVYAVENISNDWLAIASWLLIVIFGCLLSRGAEVKAGVKHVVLVEKNP